MFYLRCHAAFHNTVPGRQGSHRDIIFSRVHERLPDGARICRLVFTEQTLIHQGLDEPIWHLGAGQDEAEAFALAAAALALVGGGRHFALYFLP